MANSKIWLIEPRDPFIARDGRPFAAGGSAATLPFPFPSTTTGGVRTRAGLGSGAAFINSYDNKPNKTLIEQVKGITVQGALLVELDESGEIADWLLPAPADALWLRDKDDAEKAVLKQLVPLDVGDGVTNLNQAPHAADQLAPIGLPQPDPRKSFGAAPHYWRWAHFKEWLHTPKEITKPHKPALGHDGPVMETRTHVAIDPQTFTSAESQLFQTRGLEFTRSKPQKLGEARRLALAVCISGDAIAQDIRAGLAPLGGERRVVAWRESQKAFPTDDLDKLAAQIADDDHCRLHLLTPAFFVQGSRPAALLAKKCDVMPELCAVATPRPQVASGWDFEHYEKKQGRTVRGRPKPTRRLAPAGAVYFLKFNGGNKENVVRWVKEMWLSCVSDDAQARRDGFGLAVLGTWDGTLQPLTV